MATIKPTDDAIAVAAATLAAKLTELRQALQTRHGIDLERDLATNYGWAVDIIAREHFGSSEDS